MTRRVEKFGLKIAPEIALYVEARALPGTGLRADDVWKAFAEIVADLTPKNRALLATRDKMQGQIDTFDDRHPLFSGEAFDLEVTDLEKDVFLQSRCDCRGICHSYCSFRPEDRNSIQSTTKLTATVSSAIAAAGMSGVMSPKEISVAFSRTIEPQSAVGG